MNNRVKKEVNKAIPTFNTPLIDHSLFISKGASCLVYTEGVTLSILILITPYEDFSIRLNRVVDLLTSVNPGREPTAYQSGKHVKFFY